MLHKICFLLLILWIVPSIQTAAGSDKTVIQLKEEAAVLSDTVQVKDVANLNGTNSGLVDGLAHISLGATPEFGSVRILSRHQIGELLKKETGSLAGITIAGAPAVRIRLQGKPVDPLQVAPLIKKHLVRTTHWTESEIAVRSIGNLNGIELPQGAELRLSPNSTTRGNRGILVPIEIVLAGKTLRSLWVTATVIVRARILTAARRISYGKKVTADDVIEKTVEITDLHAAYARNLNDVLQKVSHRSYSRGTPLNRDDFKNPFLIKSGDTVQSRLVRNGIAVTFFARAEQNGTLGQVIKVRNLDFSTTLKAQVTGKAEVRVLQ